MYKKISMWEVLDSIPTHVCVSFIKEKKKELPNNENGNIMETSQTYDAQNHC